MDLRIESNFDYIESSVIEELHWDFKNTFCRSLKDSDLQINRFCSPDTVNGKQGPDGFTWQRSEILDESGEHEKLRDLAEQSDLCQVFCIRQKHSYSRLYITQGLFERLIDAYTVFNRIWDFVLPFSFKTRESDIGHAPLRFRQLEHFVPDGLCLGSFECAYTFRYVVMNGRVEGLEGNPDYDLWSVRQSTIYQQYISAKDRTTFILIAPSEIARKRLEGAVIRRKVERRRLNPFDLHRILISTLHENWRLYLRNLESGLRNQSDRVTLAQVQSDTERLSPLTDFNLNFEDRQRLKMIEDKILDLLIIFESLCNTLSLLQRQCQLHCLGSQCRDCICFKIIDEFEEQIRETKVNINRANILYKRAQGTAQLLSNLLEYENAQVAHLNEKSLNGLVKETKEENSKMRILTERSTRDAAAVKILTVITLVYLPVTVVASIFSSQLIQVDVNGRVSMVAESWWFAVVTIPLTIFTFILWRLWLFYTLRKDQGKSESDLVCERDTAHQQSWSASVKVGRFARLNEHLSTLRNRQQVPILGNAA